MVITSDVSNTSFGIPTIIAGASGSVSGHTSSSRHSIRPKRCILPSIGRYRQEPASVRLKGLTSRITGLPIPDDRWDIRHEWWKMIKNERRHMRYEIWDMRDARSEIRDARWEMRGERWAMRDEAWEIIDERWKIRWEMSKEYGES